MVKWLLSMLLECADIKPDQNEPKQLDLWEQDQRAGDDRRLSMWRALGLSR